MFNFVKNTLLGLLFLLTNVQNNENRAKSKEIGSIWRDKLRFFKVSEICI